jgi:hypothetical protein
VTRSAIWNDANCLAARSARPTFFDSNYAVANDVGTVHYAQEVFRGVSPPNHIDNPPLIRLDETLLPDWDLNYVSTIRGSNLFPSFLPSDTWFKYDSGGRLTDERFLSGMLGVNSYSIAGRTLSIADVHTTTSTFPRRSIVISEGRHKPSHRMRSGLFLFSYWGSFSPSATPIDFSPFSDGVGAFYALKTTHVPLSVMFVPKTNGAASLSGVYVALRPMFNLAQYRSDGNTPVDYASPRLPLGLINLLEIGEFAGTEFTARKRLIVAAGSVDIDCGSSRNKLGAESGTTFCCVFRAGYAQAIEFAHVPQSADHCLCGTLSGDYPAQLLARQTQNIMQLHAQIATGRRGFNAGECPAFEKKALDHGQLVRIPFFAGAPRSKHWQIGQQQGTYFGPRNVAPQWSTWERSQFPYTMHKTGALTVDGTVVPTESLTGQRQINTPVYELIDYTDGVNKTVEHYPDRIVSAKAARIQATATGSHFEDAMMTIGKPRDDGKMVFNGKVINGVSLTFVPYARQAFGDSLPIFSGIDPAQLPTPSPDGNEPYVFGQGDSSQFFAVNLGQLDTWWRYRQSISLPANAYKFPGDPAQIWRGEWCRVRQTLSDKKIVEYPAPFVEVSGSKEIDAHLFGACLVSTDTSNNPAGFLHSSNAPNFSVSGTIDQWKIGGFVGQPWRDGRYGVSGFFMNGIMPAPLTGSYDLSRFSIGDVQSAGNMFRYSGVGRWSFDRTVTYNIYPLVTSIDDFWREEGSFNQLTGERLHLRTQSRTARYATVPITENWKMKTDCAELHCQLGSTLQQYGQYQADPTVAFNNDAQAINWLKTTFMKHDQPRGRLADTVVYVDGQEPSPVLTMALRYRTAMRAELKCTVDTSDLPEYPHSMTNSESQVIGGTVAGLTGSGTVSGANQTVDNHHGFEALAVTFSKEQTAQLMNGEEILVMQWQKETNPQRPVFADTGGIFLHAFRMRLDVATA